MAGSRLTCFGVRVPWIPLDYPAINLNPRKNEPYDNARPSQRDKQSDGQTNIMAIAQRFVLMNASRAKNIGH